MEMWAGSPFPVRSVSISPATFACSSSTPVPPTFPSVEARLGLSADSFHCRMVKSRPGSTEFMLTEMANCFDDIVATLRRLQSADPSAQEVIRNIEPIEPTEIPEPYRSLLVHEKDMTGTLAGYWGLPISLRPLTVLRDGNSLYRQVVLTAGPDRIPVEAGAIMIYLDRFPPEALPVIRQSQKPLGVILTRYNQKLWMRA